MSARESIELQCCGNCANGTLRGNGFIRCPFVPAYQLMGPMSPCAVDSWVHIEPAQVAKREAQASIELAVEKADREVHGWSDTAYAFIELFVVEHRGEKFTGHDIVEASKVKGVIQPEDARAWGGPIQRAARAGLIERVGYTEDANRHGNPIPLWSAL